MTRRHFSLNRRILALFVAVIVLAAVAAIAVMERGQTNAVPPSKAAAAKPVQSEFSFTGAVGWRKGPANKTSLALFSNDESCFTSIENKTGTVDVAAQLQKQQDDLAATGGTMTPSATLTAVIHMSTGQQQYELHQYSLSGGSEQLMGGLELGYLQLARNYLVIQGHCNTASQLPTTIPALQAYKFDPN